MSQGRLTLARIVTFVGIPALIAIERGAYYAIRGVLRRYLMDEPGGGLGLSRLESAQIPATWTLSMLPLLLVGGLIVFAAGPRIPLVAGFALMAAGAMILGHGGQAALWPALLVVAAGQGLVKPASYSVIAHEIGRGMDNLRVAACFALYAAIDIGSFASSLAISRGMPAGAGRYQTVFSMASLAFVACAAAATGLAVLLAKQGNRPEKAPAPRREQDAFDAVYAASPALPEAATSDKDRLNEALLRGARSLAMEPETTGEPRNGALGAGLLLLVLLPSLIAGTAFDIAELEAADKLHGAATRLDDVGLGIELFVSFLGGIAMLVVALTARKPAPVFYGAAAGLVLSFLGCVLFFLAASAASTGLLTLAIVCVKSGEVTLVSVALGRFLGGPSRKTIPLWATGWHLVVLGIAPVARLLTGATAQVVLGVMAPICLVAGILLAVFAARLAQLFVPAER